MRPRPVPPLKIDNPLLTLRILVMGAGAIGTYAGVVYHDPDLLALAEMSIAEVMAVGRAEGAVFAPTQAQDTLAILQGFPPELFASMHHDLVAGRPLELDGISGLVSRLGRQHGLATPFHTMADACMKPWRMGSKPDPAS